MNLLKQITLNLRIIKLKRFLGSLFYSFERDWWERQLTPAKKPQMVKPGKLNRVEPTARGISLNFEQAELEITFLASDLVRIDWQPGKLPVSYGIVDREWSEVATTLDQEDSEIKIASGDLRLIIGDDGSIWLEDTNGWTLRRELPPTRREAWQHQGQLRAEERIYGLGERAAPFNLRANRGQKYQMWHFDAGGRYSTGTDPLYLSIPVYIGLHSQGSYLIFYENTHSGNICFDEWATAHFEGGALRYYLAVGQPAHLLERYTELTGRPPLPPRWAFGYHQSRWGYESEDKVREVVQGFQDYNLPLSAIHLDIDCQDNFRSFTISPNRFPKIREFTAELQEKGVRLITITNPGINCDPNNKLYQEGIAQEIFCRLPNGNPVRAAVWGGMCAFPDFTNPLARHWWSRQYEYLLDLGVSGFWHDMNEPGVFTLWGNATLPPKATQHHLEGRGGNHLEAHNVYGLSQARAGYEALREYQPQQRPFIVSRSGWAGIARYAWTWTGDIETSWQGLRQTVATVLGMSLSGIPYTGCDIGGFKGNPSPELYLRWFQLATFLPFFRTHCANNAKPRTPWGYGEQVLKIAREFLQLRYRLIPYFYTLAWEATQKGYPPVRPLFWHNPDDKRLWDIEDAFLLGDGLLVAPIVSDKARQRELILPPGDWYIFWDDTLIEGGKTVTLDAPLEYIPLLVKAGNILPLEVEQKLILHLYPPRDENPSVNLLYSDAGDGYENGRIDRFYLQRTQNYLELTWEQQGDYPFPYEQVELHLHGIELEQAWIDDRPIAIQGQKIECQPFRQARLLENYSRN